MLLQVPPVLVQKGVHREKPPLLGLEKGGKSRILRFANEHWLVAAGVTTVPFLRPHPVWPQHPPRSPCPWQCREEEITSEVFCLNLITARAGFLLLYF